MSISNHSSIYATTHTGAVVWPVSTQDGSHNGYYFDNNRDVWSNKSGRWSKLTRSRSGGYSFSHKGRSFYCDRVYLNRLYDASVGAATQNVSSTENTQIGAANSLRIRDSISDSSGKYIIGTINGANMSISQTPVVHMSELSARNECERLAKANPGKKFVFMKLMGICTVNDTSWS